MTDKDEDKTSKNGDKALEKLLQTRTLVISEAVDSKLAKNVVRQILMLESEDPKKEIKVFINSPGGEINSGFAIYDMLGFVSCPVTTLVIGLAASMGSILSLAGNENRVFCLSNAKIMIHQPLLTGAQGTASDLEIHSNEIIKTKHHIADLYSAKTGKTQKKILADMNRDKWFNAKEAVEYGLIDKILTRRKELP